MRSFLLGLLVVLVTGCAWGGEFVYENPDRMSLKVVGTPTVRENGFRSRWTLVLPEGSEAPHSIQDVNPEWLDWIGVEAHTQPMWIVDFHYHTQNPPYEYTKRTMFVRPGEVRNVEWHPKGVAMLWGWPGRDPETGRYHHNALYFLFYSMRDDAEIVWEEPDQGTYWVLEFFPRNYPNTNYPYARLRLTIPDTPIIWEWDETGLLQRSYPWAWKDTDVD